MKGMTISNKLRELMTRYRMAQEGLAKMAGITRQTISQSRMGNIYHH